MTTLDKNRIVRKNLDYSTKFNVFMVNHDSGAVLPSNACVVFADKLDPMFTEVNKNIAVTISANGGVCYVAEHSADTNWNVFPFKTV